MATAKSKEDKLIDAAMRLAAKRPWSEVSLSDIAKSARVPLSALAPGVASKADILAAFSRRIDGEVLENLDEEVMEEGPRDRVFDILMARFDALAPYKPALKSIAKSYGKDPLTGLASAPAVLQSLGWMLEGAGVDTSGIGGALRVRGLALIWFAAFRVWLDDEDDLAKTMAELDRRLRQGEDVLSFVGRLSGRAVSPKAAPPSEAAETPGPQTGT